MSWQQAFDESELHQIFARHGSISGYLISAAGQRRFLIEHRKQIDAIVQEAQEAWIVASDQVYAVSQMMLPVHPSLTPPS